MKIVHFSPKVLAAKARDAPHCPAPVSVTTSVAPSLFATCTCIKDVFGLWLPVSETLSSFAHICAGVPSNFSSAYNLLTGVGLHAWYILRISEGMSIRTFLSYGGSNSSIFANSSGITLLSSSSVYGFLVFGFKG